MAARVSGSLTPVTGVTDDVLVLGINASVSGSSSGGTSGTGTGGSSGNCGISVTQFAAATANLTSEGTADWVFINGDYDPTNCQNGTTGTPTCTPIERKTSGNLIGPLKVVSVPNAPGPPYLHPVGGTPRMLSWTDGTPAAASPGAGGALSIENGGFTITAPAETSARTFILHTGITNGSWTATLTAHLSDGSAPDQTMHVTADPSQSTDLNFKIIYQASQSGQTLTVTFLQDNLSSAPDQEIYFSGAALSLGGTVTGMCTGGTGTGGTGTGGTGGTGGIGGTGGNATVTGVTLESGSFANSTFTNIGTWTTLPASDGFYTLGISLAGDSTNPLLNNPTDRSVNLKPGGFYFTYSAQAGEGNALRVTLQWSDGRPNDVTIFNKGGDFTVSQQFAVLCVQKPDGTCGSTPTNIYLASTGIANAMRVPAGTGLTSDGSPNDVLNLGILQSGMCDVSFNPPVGEQAYNQATLPFTIVTTDPSCQWSISPSSNPSALFATPSSGTGTTAVTLTDGVNTGEATYYFVPVNGFSFRRPFVVNQAAAPGACAYSVSPDYTTIPQSGGSTTFTVTAGAGCQWTIHGAGPTETVTPTSGSGGTTTVTFTENQANPYPFRLGVTLSADAPDNIGGAAIQIDQLGIGGGSGGSGGTGGTGGTGGSGGTGGTCTDTFTGQWSSTYTGSNSSASAPMTLTQNGSSVTGTYVAQGSNQSGTISGTLSGNTLTATWTQPDRSGTLTFTLSADGNSFTGTWTCTAGCTDSGTWNGTRVESCTGGTATAACAGTISPFGQQIGSGGGAGMPITVTANCSWTAVSNNPSMIQITFGASGSGNGTVTFTVTNNGGASRYGTITIAGQTYAVYQDGTPSGTTANCQYPITSNRTQTYDATGSPVSGTGTTSIITFPTGQNCAWTAAVSYADPANTGWVTITVPAANGGVYSGIGNGAVQYSVAANGTANPRTAAIVIAGQNVVILQAAGAAPGAPSIGSGGIVNAASYASGGPPNGLAQGSYFSIFGTGLGPPTPAQQPFGQFPLPTTVGGVGVQIISGSNTYDAYLIFASSTQINGILPSNVPVGNAQVKVTYNGATSLAADILVSSTSFGVFYQSVNGNNVAVAQNPIGNYPLNSPSAPAQPTDPSKPGTGIVLVWGTGLGAVAGGDNVPPGSNAVDITNLPVTITVGGISAQRLYAGRQSQSAGVDNVYFMLPPGVPFGCYVPVAITAGGVAANTTTIAITADGSPCQ